MDSFFDTHTVEGTATASDADSSPKESDVDQDTGGAANFKEHLREMFKMTGLNASALESDPGQANRTPLMELAHGCLDNVVANLLEAGVVRNVICA